MIKVNAADFQIKELNQGNPVQLRAIVPIKLSDEIRKGNYVEVVNSGSSYQATISTDPSVIVKKTEDGKHMELSIEVSRRLS